MVQSWLVGLGPQGEGPGGTFHLLAATGPDKAALAIVTFVPYRWPPPVPKAYMGMSETSCQ